ncbi:MAG: branched-chain amino acid ABC transporter permease, partial [Pseudomonadota bacterium]
VFAVLAPLIVAALVAAPLWADRGLIQDLFFILTMLVLAQLWNLLAGYGGPISIGQQAFVGMGAYATFGAVILWGMDPVAALVLGSVAAVVLAVPTAFFAFRLVGAYFAVGTWVIADLTRLIVSQWRAVGGGTGTSLPREARADMWGVEWIAALFDLRAAAARDVLTYWLALALAIAVVGGVYLLLRARQGLALTAMRDNPEAAGAVGVDARRVRWTVFLIAAFGTGICGALIFLQNGRTSPDAAFSVVDWTAYVIFIVVIGGIGTVEGPILGVLIFFALQSTLSQFGAWYLMALGALAIIVMLLAPRGLWGLISDRTGVQLFPIRRRLVRREE